jgi:hypothetical protein
MRTHEEIEARLECIISRVREKYELSTELNERNNRIAHAYVCCVLSDFRSWLKEGEEHDPIK